jgi:acetyltransferase
MDMTFGPLFSPRGVAVIGSMTPGKLGSVLLKQLLDGGFEGGLFAVNPKGEGAFNLPGYTSATQIGSPVDLVIIASPAPSIPDVFRDCGKAGVKAAVVITAGFSEVGNHAGEAALAQAARDNGIRVVGPNCAGIVNTHAKLFPTLEVKPPVGNVALISQSGALGGVVLAAAERQGLGISKFVSYGNGVDLGQVDFLRYLANDPETKVVALYIESVNNGRDFMESLSICCREKPVVLIKAGRTSVGQRATASHTGSMAGADAVYDAALKECGAIRVKSVEEMLDLCNGFSYIPPIHGDRIVIVTNSGGPGVLGADVAAELGLKMPEPSADAQARLRKFLPGHCSLKNPIDLTVEGTEEGYKNTLLQVLDEYDAAVGMDICPPYLDPTGHARGIVAAAAESGKPFIANFLPDQVVGEGVKVLKTNGIPNYPSGERAITTLAAIVRYTAFKVSINRPGINHDPYWSHAKSLPKKEPLGTKQMLEPEAMAWLQTNGISVPRFSFAKSEEDTVRACSEIGYPTVIKVVSPDILHKSDSGGVVVNVQNEQQARKSFQNIQLAAAGKDFRGAIIYPMIRGGQEVLIGMTRDPQFGPVIAFGLGGIYTEILHEFSLRIAPFNKDVAIEMIHDIKSIRMLTGARGAQPCDLNAIAELLVRVSELPFDYPEITEMDLNPVFAMPEGALVGDVRVIIK